MKRVKKSGKKKTKIVAEKSTRKILTGGLTIAEAKRNLMIDKNSLDEDMIRHPMILSEIGMEYVKANDTRDRLKNLLEQTEGNVYLHLRESMEKPTDTTLKQAVKIHPEFVKIRTEFMDAKHAAAEWDVLWTAFGQRSYMLNKLAELYTTQFYSKNSYERPKVDRTNQLRKRKV